MVWVLVEDGKHSEKRGDSPKAGLYGSLVTLRRAGLGADEAGSCSTADGEGRAGGRVDREGWVVVKGEMPVRKGRGDRTGVGTKLAGDMVGEEVRGGWEGNEEGGETGEEVRAREGWVDE